MYDRKKHLEQQSLIQKMQNQEKIMLQNSQGCWRWESAVCLYTRAVLSYVDISPKDKVTSEYMDLPFHSVAWIQFVLEVIQGFWQRKIGTNSEEWHGIDRNGKTLGMLAVHDSPCSPGPGSKFIANVSHGASTDITDSVGKIKAILNNQNYEGMILWRV